MKSSNPPDEAPQGSSIDNDDRSGSNDDADDDICDAATVRVSNVIMEPGHFQARNSNDRRVSWAVRAHK